MILDDRTIKDILLKGNYLSEADAKKAEEVIKKNGGALVGYLSKENLISADILGQALAESFGVPYADLNSKIPAKELVLKIPAVVAKKFRIILLAEEKKGLKIATDDPTREGLKETIISIFPETKVSIMYSLSADIDSIIDKYYRQTLKTRFSKILKSDKQVAPEIINEIFNDALSFRASDIHFEPQSAKVLVRFRVDGILQEAGDIPREYYENILNRIKVQSRLRIDEHYRTQDGSMRYEKDNQMVDLRVSITPTIEGEKVVIRVLAAYVQGLNLSDLGLSQSDQVMLERAAQKPFGMILVTGPTGSGKTTTLYSLLRILNNSEVNITTIEDPVEYKVTGVNQIQVNPAMEVTFAKGLRSIVRQDPDIILVGEIRDVETADIAVNAALTGHLLLSTFHANDAATAVPRLLDMGSEPFLLASTLEIIIAQRLIRRICEQCRYSTVVTAKDFVNQGKNFEKYFGAKATLYRGKGCVSCGHTGYNGRVAIFEFIQITPAMQDLILRSPATQEIWALARKQGSKSLFEDGVEKVKNGMTTVEELLRVAEPPEEKDRASK